MVEKRSYPRKNVDLQATVQVSREGHGTEAKMVELSLNGATALFPQSISELDAEMELHFNLPFLRSGHELRLGCKFRHMYKTSDGSQIVGVVFSDIQDDEIAALEKFISMTR